MSGNEGSKNVVSRAMRELSADELNAVAGGVTQGPDGGGCTDPRRTSEKAR